jgi:hypothetical protein
MDLRIYRTWYWVNVSDRIGGQPELVLRHRDELQYCADGAWRPVHVEEAPKPENPEERRQREAMERNVAALDAALGDALKRAVADIPFSLHRQEEA